MEEEQKVIEVNPKRCYFIVTYPDGRIVKGNALSNDAWKQVPEGIAVLRYELSDESEIKIPGYKAYSVEVDHENGIYYAINVSCLSETEVVVYRINLRQVEGSNLKIGHVITGRRPVPKEMDNSWKHRG